MKIEKDNPLKGYVVDILSYLDKDISLAFKELSLKNQIVALAVAPEPLFSKFVSDMEEEALMTLVKGISEELIRYEDDLTFGVYALIANKLKSGDTIEEAGRKEEMLVSLYNALANEEKKRLLLETLDSMNADAAHTIRENIIDEWSFVHTDDLSLQRLIREIDNSQLAVFLLRGSTALQNKFFSNMSSRMSTMMKEEMAYLGNVSDKEHQVVSEMIIRLFRAMGEASVLIIPKRL